MMKKVFLLFFILVFLGCKKEDVLLSFEYLGRDWQEYNFLKNLPEKDSVIFLLKNNSSKNILVINSIELDNKNFSFSNIYNQEFVFPLHINPLDNVGVLVSYNPKVSGVQDGNLSVNVNILNDEREAITKILKLSSSINSIGTGHGNSGIATDKNFLIFDNTFTGQYSSQMIEFKNISKNDIIISDIIVGSPYFLEKSFSIKNLMPLESVFYKILFKPSVEGDFFQSLICVTNSGRFEIPMEGRADTILKPFLVVTDEKNNFLDKDSILFLSDVGNGLESAPISIFLQNKGKTPLVIKNIAIDNQEFFKFYENVAMPRTLQENGILNIKLKFAPKNRVGILTQPLIISSNSEGGDLFFLNLQGNALSSDMAKINLTSGNNLISNGAQFTFPGIKVNENIECKFIIKNVGIADLNINKISLSDTANFRIIEPYNFSSQSIETGETLEVKIKFSANQEQAYHNRLTIISNDTKDSNFSIDLQGICFSELPILPPAINFLNESPTYIGAFLPTAGNENPSFSFTKKVGSADITEFAFRLQKGGVAFAGENSGTGATYIPATQLPSGSDYTLYVKGSANGIWSPEERLNFVVVREKPSKPVVFLLEKSFAKYVLHIKDGVTYLFTNDKKPVWKWNPKEGEENNISTYRYRYNSGMTIPNETAWTEIKINEFSNGQSVALLDGEYIFQVKCVDHYGQESEFQEFLIYVDTKPPVINLNMAKYSSSTKIVIPKNITSAQLEKMDTLASAVDAVFGECPVNIDYSNVVPSIKGTYKIIYTAQDNLKNSTQNIERDLEVIDTDSLSFAIVNNLSDNNNLEFPIGGNNYYVKIKNSYATPTGQLKYNYFVDAEGTQELKIENTTNSFFQTQFIHTNVQERKAKTLTCKLIFYANSESDNIEKNITKNINVYPQFDLKDMSFEGGYVSGNWKIDLDYYIDYNYSLWSDEWMGKENGLTVAGDHSKQSYSSGNEPIFRIVTGSVANNTRADRAFVKPDEAPEAPHGSKLFKFCDLRKYGRDPYYVYPAGAYFPDTGGGDMSHDFTIYKPDDIIVVEATLYQKIKIIANQKYRISVKVRNYNPHTQQCGLVVTPDRNFNISTPGFIITTEGRVNTDSTEWQTLTADFQSNLEEVYLGFYKDGDGQSNAWSGKYLRAIFVDDFKMEYIN